MEIPQGIIDIVSSAKDQITIRHGAKTQNSQQSLRKRELGNITAAICV